MLNKESFIMKKKKNFYLLIELEGKNQVIGDY